MKKRRDADLYGLFAAPAWLHNAKSLTAGGRTQPLREKLPARVFDGKNRTRSTALCRLFPPECLLV